MTRWLLPVLLALSATPALAEDGRVWSYEGGERPMLAYATPDSDDAGVTLYCQAGEGVIHTLMFVKTRLATDEPRADGTWVDAKGRPAPWKGVLKLSAQHDAGGMLMVGAAELQARVTPDEMSGGSMLEGLAPPSAAVFQSFAKSGRITLSAFGETQSPPPAPTDKIEALLTACAKAKR